MKKERILGNFVDSYKVEKILEVGFTTRENVVLYGPPGFGKSEMSYTFLLHKVKEEGLTEKDIFVKSLSIGTTVDDLFGGINIKELTETGNIRYNLEDSMFNSKYVILEEAFDAPPQVLSALKDAITSGYVRNGNQVFKVKTKFIIICTNKTKDEIAINDSTRALVERFPLSLRVFWEDFKYQKYYKLGIVNGINIKEDKVLNDVILALTRNLEDSEIYISPRIFKKMLKVYKAGGVSALGFIEELAACDINSIFTDTEAFQFIAIKTEKRIIAEIQKALNNADIDDDEEHDIDENRAAHRKAVSKVIRENIKDIRDFKLEDKVIQAIETLSEYLTGEDLEIIEEAYFYETI